MSIDELLSIPRAVEGADGRPRMETPEEVKERLANVDRIFRNVLSTVEGHKLIQILTSAVNPIRSRFASGASPEMAAYRDGQCDIIGELIVRGTNMGISTPDL